MASPAGTLRTATNARLVELIGGLTGFSTTPATRTWWVTRPPNGQAKNRRFVVIGVGSGSVEIDGIGAGHDPSVDVWVTGCLIQVADLADRVVAEQACEDAYNAIADALAATKGRLDMNPGPRGVAVTGDLELSSGQDAGSQVWAQATFTISATCDIERNPS